MKILKTKRNILIILSVAVLLMAAGWFYYANQYEEKVVSDGKQNAVKETAKKDVRELVWERLPADQIDRIDGTWKDGKVSKVIVTESGISPLGNQSYIGKEVYVIDFPAKRKSIPDNILIYADIDTYEFVGNGTVE